MLALFEAIQREPSLVSTLQRDALSAGEFQQAILRMVNRESAPTAAKSSVVVSLHGIQVRDRQRPGALRDVVLHGTDETHAAVRASLLITISRLLRCQNLFQSDPSFNGNQPAYPGRHHPGQVFLLR
jgi:hypothetical protein